MKTLRPITQTLHQPRTLRLANTPFRRQQTNHDRLRTQSFLTNSFSGPQTLTASRTLPYPQRAIFDVISDVSSYHTYLPFCKASTVTRLSGPTETDGKRYPEEGKLSIGFNEGVSEEFWSRVYCVPCEVVEAVSGRSDTTLEPITISHHSSRAEAGKEDPTRNEAVLTHLLTRWQLRPFMYKPPPASATHPSSTHKNHDETSPVPSREKTDVSLHIEFQFANPVYAALSQAAAPKVAEKMIEAFERRVKEVCEGPGSAR